MAIRFLVPQIPERILKMLELNLDDEYAIISVKTNWRHKMISVQLGRTTNNRNRSFRQLIHFTDITEKELTQIEDDTYVAVVDPEFNQKAVKA